MITEKEIKSAKQTKKEYAEKPFSLKYMEGTQFTIEEKLGVSEVPRTNKLISKSGNPYTVVAIKISNGMFEKDMHLFGQEWDDLCAAIPDSLVNMQGLTMKVSRNRATLRPELEYVGMAVRDAEGKTYSNDNPAVVTPDPKEGAPTEIGNQIKMLHQGVELNYKMKIDTDIKKLTEMAEAIRPGDALNLITAAKREGWICEVVPGKYRGT